MEEDEKKDRPADVSLTRTFTADLRGRQSVRATFKLSEGCIDAISIVAAHLGIKQKSLFDHLVEDARNLRAIAREIQNIKISRQGRIQKTFVISRKSLTSLDRVSKNYNAPRDALVEFSVQRLLPIIAKEREKHAKRKEILDTIADHFNEGKSLLYRLRDVLGVEDPVCQKLETVMAVYENAYANIEAFVERSKIIEEFDPDTLKEIFSVPED